MRLLDRYLLRELLVPFGYCLLGFFIFWVAFDLFSDLSDFQKHQLQVTDVLEYYFFKTPELLGVTLPITLLLSLLYSLTNHARYHELTAIRAAGISLYRVSLPYFGLSIILSLVLLTLNEWWIPQSLERTDEILSRYETNQTRLAEKDWDTNFAFINTRERRRWVIEAFHHTSSEMRRPHVEWTLEDETRRDFYAEAGIWTNGSWHFTNVQEFVWPPGRGAIPIPSHYPSRVMKELNETPEEIRIQSKLQKIESFRQARKAQLTIREILLYLRLYPEDVAKKTLLHGRLAAPFTCLVVVLIALPFGAAPGRRNAFVGVASSILICFAYFVFQQFSLALGFSGRMPGWLAGWLPNLLFGLAGLLFTQRLR